MLSPNYLSNVTYDIEQLFAMLETDILSDVARRIKENGIEMTATANHQLNRLNALGVQYEEVSKTLVKALTATEEKVAQILSESSYKSVDADNKIFKEAFDKGFIPKFEYKKENLKDIILKGISSTNKDLRNICNSMASVSNKIYGDAIDMAYLSVQSGAFSQADAIKNAVKKVAKEGYVWVDYPSGAHRRPDSAIRNAVRTGVNQTASRCQDKNFDDMGGNLVETSSHMGARPDHATWQGKVYWRKKQYKSYRNFELSTGYGSGAGLGGWGCRHSFFPFFEGLSSKSFEHYRLGENKERYILEQEQRYNERMIREWKRRSSVNYSGGVDNSKEAKKVKEWTRRQSDFLDAHPDMKRNYARESVVIKNNQTIKTKAKNNKLKEYYAMDDKNVRIKVENREYGIHKKNYETAYIYDQNGNILLNKRGMKGEVSFTDDELKLMKDAVVTHNHPMGTTFSPDDIYMAIEHNLQEVRATGTNGTYVMRRNENLHLMPLFDDFVTEYVSIIDVYKEIYMKRYPGKVDRLKRQQVVQANAMNKIAEKYGLLYWREVNEI